MTHSSPSAACSALASSGTVSLASASPAAAQAREEEAASPMEGVVTLPRKRLERPPGLEPVEEERGGKFQSYEVDDGDEGGDRAIELIDPGGAQQSASSSSGNLLVPVPAMGQDAGGESAVSWIWRGSRSPGRGGGHLAFYVAYGAVRSESWERHGCQAVARDERPA